jgi:hypothetical protein
MDFSSLVGVPPLELILLVVVTFVLSNIPLISKLVFDKIKNKNIKAKGADPHAYCQHGAEFAELQREVARIKKELLEINILRKYMSTADKKLIQIKGMMMGEFKKNSKTTESDIRHYAKLLDFSLNKTKDFKLKQYIKANHFLDKNDIEWRVYKEDVAETLQSYHIMLLDEEFHSEDYSITRKELFKLNEPIMGGIYKEIILLFDELKEMAKDA